jgi:predicted RNA-binding Zn ribbon-like protein
MQTDNVVSPVATGGTVVGTMANNAPGLLGLVQDFVNTHELDEARDDIGTPEALGAWLEEHGLLTAGAISAQEHTRALELREAVRHLLLVNNGAPADAADLDFLNRVAADSDLRPRFVPTGKVVLEATAPGVPGALGRLLAAVSTAMVEGTWSRLKACADDACRWAFYDRSKNHSGHWCSMEVCGNRAKARQFRQRRRAGIGG